jgi:hypothetical protein
MNTISNNQLYHFSDFTFNNYRKLLRLAKLRFKFCDFNIDFENETNYVLWRHDLEFSIKTACHLAQIEEEEKVKSNFFVQLHSEYYNTLDKRVVELIRNNIINSGHAIGLHFDAHFYNITKSKQLDYYIQKDKTILEDVFEVKIIAFSFHNTNSLILSYEDDHYGGLINVYSKRIKSIPYCSDSLGYWRIDRLQDRIEDAKINKLQVLTHDAMWSEKIMSPRQRIRMSIQKDADVLMQYYDEYLREYGHKNIDENNVEN